MKKRVITAILALIIFLPILIIGGIPVAIFASLMGAIGVYELFKMNDLEIKSQEGIFAMIGVVFLIFPFSKYLSFLPSDANWILFFLVVLIYLGMLVFYQGSYTFEEAGFPVLVSLYVGVGFHYFVAARMHSLLAVLFALFIVWSTDIGAYMIGRQYGNRKLAPSVSPNKTIEGALGGMLSTVVVSAIYLFIFPAQKHFHLPFLYMVFMSAVFSIFAQFGDLVESAIKRHYGVKDSGWILPGHGGILDRFDSLLFVFPILHLFRIF